jgi:hypothetical protein
MISPFSFLITLETPNNFEKQPPLKILKKWSAINPLNLKSINRKLR